MAVKCPRCGREFDITLFEFGKSIICTCGRKLNLQHLIVYPDMDELEKGIFESANKKYREDDRKKMEGIKLEADRITNLILYSDLPRIDVEISIRDFKSRVLETFPDKEELFDAIYLSRFRRIWKQFRHGDQVLLEDE